jgi:hypothetical protein
MRIRARRDQGMREGSINGISISKIITNQRKPNERLSSTKTCRKTSIGQYQQGQPM